MPLSKSGRGITVDLGEFKKLHLDGSDECFLDIPSQNVIRAGELGRFLARAEEDSEKQVLRFQLTTDGEEALSRSQGLGNKRDIPLREIDRLEAALTALREKPHLDPTLPPKSIKLIERLQLPDPDAAPEMYRVYGSSWDRRLGIVWGCEKASGKSVAPSVAIERLRRRGRPSWLFLAEQLLWLLLLAIPFALLAALIWYVWGSPESDKPTIDPGATSPAKFVQLTTQTLTQQYLRVRLSKSSGLPNDVEAWAELPGILVFPGGHEERVQAEDRRRFTVVSPGNVRVEWKPDPSETNLHGEFVDLVFRDDGTVVVPQPSEVGNGSGNANSPNFYPLTPPTARNKSTSSEQPTATPELDTAGGVDPNNVTGGSNGQSGAGSTQNSTGKSNPLKGPESTEAAKESTPKSSLREEKPASSTGKPTTLAGNNLGPTGSTLPAASNNPSASKTQGKGDGTPDSTPKKPAVNPSQLPTNEPMKEKPSEPSPNVPTSEKPAKPGQSEATPEKPAKPEPPVPTLAKPIVPPAKAPITVEGNLAIELVRAADNQVTLQAKSKENPAAQLSDVAWSIDGRKLTGNPVKFSPEQDRIRIEVTARAGDKMFRAQGLLQRNFVLNENP